MEEDKYSKGLTAKIDKIFDEGDSMRKKTGGKTAVQHIKEGAAIGGIALTGVGGMGVMIGVDNYSHPKNDITPENAHVDELPLPPAHTTKTPQQFIKEFEDKNLGGKGHAEKIEGGKEAPVKSR